VSLVLLGPAGPGTSTRRSRHEPAVLLATVLGVASLLAWPVLAALLGAGAVPQPDHDGLSRLARLAQQRLPGAYVLDGRVVVPAVVDPHVAELPRVSADDVVGERVHLTANGLLPYGSLPTRRLPRWLVGVSASDRVFHDAGYLSLACVRPKRGEPCHAALLTEVRGFVHLVAWRPTLLRPRGLAWVVVLRHGVPAELVLGTAPPQTARVTGVAADPRLHRTMVDVSAPGAIGGHTVWWTSARPDQRVTYWDADGRLLGGWSGSP
jgi:hypothetical protein